MGLLGLAGEPGLVNPLRSAPVFGRVACGPRSDSNILHHRPALGGRAQATHGESICFTSTSLVILEVNLMTNEKQTGSERGGAGNFANDSQRASEAGKKGGEHSHGGSQQSASHERGSQQGGSQSEGGSRGGQSGSANDRTKGSEAGKKGGEHSPGSSQQSGSHERGSQQGGSQSEAGGSRGGQGSFSNDRDKASEAGKKGGEHSHGGK
jgi:general stress protein YciG